VFVNLKPMEFIVRITCYVVVIASMLLTAFGVGCGGGSSGCPGADVARDVRGILTFADHRVVSSTCPPQLTQMFESAPDFLPPNCRHEVLQSGADVTTALCTGVETQGCVDEDGILRGSTSSSASDGGCTIRIAGPYSADLSVPEPTVRETHDVSITGQCAVTARCRIQVESDFIFTPASSAAVALRAAGDVGEGGDTLDRSLAAHLLRTLATAPPIES